MRMLKIVAALLFCGVAANAAEPPETVEYKRVGERALMLHVFKPEGWSAADSRAAVVFYHGGGWRGGQPLQFYPQAEQLAALGLVAFSVEYRLTSEDGVTGADCIEDAKSAMRYVRSHADKFGIDPDRIAASGGSAGGHLAAAVAMVPGFDAPAEDTGVSCVPNALALFNPALDLSGIPPRYGWGDDALKASPMEHVRTGLPPTIVFHGTDDTTVPFTQAERFTEAMVAAGNECKLAAYEGRGHGFFNQGRGEEDFRDTTEKMTAFLRGLGYFE